MFLRHVCPKSLIVSVGPTLCRSKRLILNQKFIGSKQNVQYYFYLKNEIKHVANQGLSYNL